MLISIILNGIVDVIGLALVLPVIACFNPSVIESNAYLSSLYQLTGFDNTDHFLLLLVGIMLSAFIIKNILGIIVTYIQSSFSYKIGIELANSQFKKELNRGLLHFTNTNSSYIVRAVVAIPLEFSSNILIPGLLIANEIFVIIFIALGIVVYDLNIFLLIAITLIPGFLIFYQFSKKKIQELGELKNELLPRPYKIMFNTILGYTDVVLSNSKAYFINRTIGSLKNLYQVLIKLFVFESIPIRLIELTAIFGMSLLFSYFILFRDNRVELLGFLVLFATAAYRLMPSLNRILSALVKIKSSTYVFDILAENENPEEIMGNTKHKENDKFKFNNGIKLKEIEFGFLKDKPPIINELNLSIEKGEYIGIIGGSGAGKTTLINILLGLIKIQKGEFLIDGQQLNRNLQSWYSIIGYVQQNIFLIDGDFVENIAFGQEEHKVNIERVKECVKQAKLEEFIDNLPNGLQTQVGEFGAKLSGGQRQRIAIARALYKQPKILILDEATSALDGEVESVFLKTIKELSNQGITIISIAHRHSSLKHCHKIYEIRDGIISKEMNYQELIKNPVEL